MTHPVRSDETGWRRPLIGTSFLIGICWVGVVLLIMNREGWGNQTSAHLTLMLAWLLLPTFAIGLSVWVGDRFVRSGNRLVGAAFLAMPLAVIAILVGQELAAA